MTFFLDVAIFYLLYWNDLLFHAYAYIVVRAKMRSDKGRVEHACKLAHGYLANPASGIPT